MDGQRQIAEKIDVHQPTVSLTLRRLRTLGWITPRGRTRWLLHPSPSAETLSTRPPPAAGSLVDNASVQMPAQLHPLFGAGGLGPGPAETFAALSQYVIRLRRGRLIRARKGSAKTPGLTDPYRGSRRIPNRGQALFSGHNLSARVLERWSEPKLAAPSLTARCGPGTAGRTNPRSRRGGSPSARVRVEGDLVMAAGRDEAEPLSCCGGCSPLSTVPCELDADRPLGARMVRQLHGAVTRTRSGRARQASQNDLIAGPATRLSTRPSSGWPRPRAAPVQGRRPSGA